MTIAANHLIPFSVALLSASALISVLSAPAPTKETKEPNTSDDAKPAPNQVKNHKPFLSAYRAVMMLMTCASILAVDFPIFPRRFAKVETFGTSLMDLGVGTFVFSSGIVASRAYLRKSAEQTSLPKQLLSAVRSSLPAIILGFARFALTKGVDYQVRFILPLSDRVWRTLELFFHARISTTLCHSPRRAKAVARALRGPRYHRWVRFHLHVLTLPLTTQPTSSPFTTAYNTTSSSTRVSTSLPCHLPPRPRCWVVPPATRRQRAEPVGQPHANEPGCHVLEFVRLVVVCYRGWRREDRVRGVEAYGMVSQFLGYTRAQCHTYTPAFSSLSRPTSPTSSGSSPLT
ncbi:hypothetical protein BC936DRAFT_139262 [Jimgerdemannia flammicorona]|uniref:GPI-anchored wall transfer protein 1 n=1 Tax=Jimgerdemannia flammicorona TaxID=994334 RepID=A0A433BA95_9FUNG|nr:hypothetical protein BC936DRAFT_139262 [Jimgerdemannia flammicorona]